MVGFWMAPFFYPQNPVLKGGFYSGPKNRPMGLPVPENFGNIFKKIGPKPGRENFPGSFLGVLGLPGAGPSGNSLTPVSLTLFLNFPQLANQMVFKLSLYSNLRLIVNLLWVCLLGLPSFGRDWGHGGKLIKCLSIG